MGEHGSRDGDRIAHPWGARTPYGVGQAWPVRVDEQVGGEAGRPGGPVEVERWVQSACVLCSNGCGLDIGVAGGRIVGEDKPAEPERLHSELFGGTRGGGLGLLRDLHDLYLMATECEVTWALVGQAAQAARDADLLDTVERCRGEVDAQLKWLRTRMKQAAPQALVVAD